VQTLFQLGVERELQLLGVFAGGDVEQEAGETVGLALGIAFDLGLAVDVAKGLVRQLDTEFEVDGQTVFTGAPNGGPNIAAILRVDAVRGQLEELLSGRLSGRFIRSRNLSVTYSA
jgi:hypothetical protein